MSASGPKSFFPENRLMSFLLLRHFLQKLSRYLSSITISLLVDNIKLVFGFLRWIAGPIIIIV